MERALQASGSRTNALVAKLASRAAAIVYTQGDLEAARTFAQRGLEVARRAMAAVHNGVRAQYQKIFGDEPTDDELEDWTRWAMTLNQRMQRRGRSPAGAAVAAEERFIERFETDPQVRYEANRDEENTELRDSLTTIGQAIDALG